MIPRQTESSKTLETLYEKIKNSWIGLPEETKDMNSAELRAYLLGYNGAYKTVLGFIDEVKDNLDEKLG